MTKLDFEIKCVPPTKTAQQKRLAIVKGKPMFFHPKKAGENEQLLAGLLEPFVPESPVEGPVFLSVIVTWPWRKSDLSTIAKRERAERFGWDYYEGKPDCSNFIKGFEDLLVSMRFIADDKHVAHLRVEKRVGNSPGISVSAHTMARDRDGLLLDFLATQGPSLPSDWGAPRHKN